MKPETKITNQDFQFFKKECKYWIERLKLDNWKIYFYLGDASEDSYATSVIKLSGYVCSVYLAKTFSNDDDKSIRQKLKETAKHEMIHLLLGRMSVNMWTRSISKNELTECEEEVIRKLEGIIG